MNNVFLIVGGNLGNKEKNLSTVRELIEQQVGVIKKLSSVYETEPWGVDEQPVYYNQVIELLTEMSAERMMQRLLSIEKKMGRVRENKYDARIIDIDILFFNDEVHQTQELTIPHARLHERRFVLEPLNEIAPEFIHPVLQKTIATLLNETSDNAAVKKINWYLFNNPYF